MEAVLDCQGTSAIGVVEGFFRCILPELRLRPDSLGGGTQFTRREASSVVAREGRIAQQSRVTNGIEPRHRSVMKRKRPQWSSTRRIAMVAASWAIVWTIPCALAELGNLEIPSPHTRPFESRRLQENSQPSYGSPALPPETIATSTPSSSGQTWVITYYDSRAPTASPTESPAPSPAPSCVPSVSPTTSPMPTAYPTGTPTESPRPSPSPSAAPTITSAPTTLPPSTLTPTSTPITASPTTLSPTILQTSSPTRQPTYAPTVLSTASPTAQPTALPTTSPTHSPTVTRQPSRRPTQSPTQVPSLNPTSRPPTAVPTDRPHTKSPSAYPTEGLPALEPSQVSLAPAAPNLNTNPPTPQDPSPPAPAQTFDVPLRPFNITLTFNSFRRLTGRMLALDQSDLDDVAAELEAVLPNFFIKELTGLVFGSGLNLTNVILDVIPDQYKLQTRSADNIFVRGSRTLQQGSETANFVVNGTTVFGAEDTSNINKDEISNDVGSSVQSKLEDPDTAGELVAYVKNNSDSPLLQTTTAASATFEQVNETASDDDDQPSVVSIIFGFTIVLLGAAGLAGYGYMFWNRRKKRLARRKRERQGQFAIYREGSRKVSEKPQNAVAASIKSETKPKAKLPPQDDDSSSASSYRGIGSETSSEAGDSDHFARELKSAASLDRRAWDDFERRRQSLQAEARVGRRDMYPTQYAVGGESFYDDMSQGDEGIEITDGELRNFNARSSRGNDDHREGEVGSERSTQDTALKSVRSFPYGDEDEEPGAKGASVSSSEGVEWTTAGILGTLGKNNNKDHEGNDSLSPYGADDEDEEFKLYNDQDWNVDKSYNRGDAEVDPTLELMESLTASKSKVTGSAKEKSPTYSKQSSPFREGPEADAIIARAALANLRESRSSEAASQPMQSSRAVHQSSPTVSSSGTSGAVRMSPSTSASTDLAANGPSVDGANDDPSKDSETLLTADIVKEVQRLSRFVKRYEKKREKYFQKEQERQQMIETATSNDVRSIPSVGYDALSDSASALRKGPIEESTRKDRPEERSYARTAFQLKQLEAGVEENGSSHHSWSTESKADSSFLERETKSFFSREGRDLVGRQTTRKLGYQRGEGDSSESSDSESDGDVHSEKSDDSRLGITPFNVRKLLGMGRVSPKKTMSQQGKPVVFTPEVSRPPTTNGKKGLSPIPGTPATPVDGSPEKEQTPERVSEKMLSPVSKAKAVLMASSRRGERSPERVPQELSSSKKGSRDIERPDPPASMKSTRVNVGSKDEQSKNGNSNSPKKSLALLRKNDAIMDDADSTGSVVAPFDEAESLLPSPSKASKPSEPAFKHSPIPTRRSKNSGFNNILNMFESRPKEAIFPPNESWQYNY